MKSVIKLSAIALTLAAAQGVSAQDHHQGYQHNQFLDDSEYSIQAIQERVEFAKSSSLMSIPAIIHDAALYQTRDVTGLDMAGAMSTTLENLSASVDLFGRWLCVVTLDVNAVSAFSGSYDYTGDFRATQDGSIVCFFQKQEGTN